MSSGQTMGLRAFRGFWAGACFTLTLASTLGCVLSRNPKVEYRRPYALKSDVFLVRSETFPDNTSALFSGPKAVNRIYWESLPPVAPGHPAERPFVPDLRQAKRIPAGTPVHIKKIHSLHLLDSDGEQEALITLGEGPRLTEAYAAWPGVLEVLK